MLTYLLAAWNIWYGYILVRDGVRGDSTLGEPCAGCGARHDPWWYRLILATIGVILITFAVYCTMAEYTTAR